VVSQVLALEMLVFGVLGGGEAEGGFRDFSGQDGVFALFLDAAFFPLAGQFIADGNGAHPFLDPVVGIAFGFVEGAGAFGGQFRVLNFLDAFVAHPGEPAFERLGLGAGNALDETEDALGVPALEQLASARCVELKAKGGTICPPPLNMSPREGSRLRSFLR